LDRSERDGGVEPEPTLVRAERAVVLDAIATVDLDAVLVVLPGHAEDDLALGLYQALDDAELHVLRVAAEHDIEAVEHLGRGLVELVLGGVPALDVGADLFQYVVSHGVLRLAG